jgi:hypothetical protein
MCRAAAGVSSLPWPLVPSKKDASQQHSMPSALHQVKLLPDRVSCCYCHQQHTTKVCAVHDCYTAPPPTFQQLDVTLNTGRLRSQHKPHWPY